MYILYLLLYEKPHKNINKIINYLLKQKNVSNEWNWHWKPLIS